MSVFHSNNSIVREYVDPGCDTTDSMSETCNPRYSSLNFSPLNVHYVADVYEAQSEEQTMQLNVSLNECTIENMSDSSSHSPSDGTITTVHNNNDLNNKKSIVCGVVLVDDRISATNAVNYEPIRKNSVILGSIVLNHYNYTCEDLRKRIYNQLSTVWDTKIKFNFLSKEGWPILANQENKVFAFNIITQNHVIAIRKVYEKPRLGIRNANGDCFGFIFVEYSWDLRKLRREMNDHFKRLGLNSNTIEYTYIERNGWPVAPIQESDLTVWDIIINQSICIQSGPLRMSSSSETMRPIENNQQLNALPSVKPSVNDDLLSITQKSFDNNMTQIDSAIVPERRNWNKKSTKKKTLNISFKQTTVKRNEKLSRAKSVKGGKDIGIIMISYARQEAAQHALILKDKLIKLDYNVYLDVHEIKHGSDWQDSLNNAVRNCTFFVPLVTPMYGKTQWTNREVKLADILGKTIIPINFLDTWPPDCLAIQFATTQYIPWKPTISDHESPISKSNPDIKVWDELYIKKVSDFLDEMMNDMKNNKQTNLLEKSLVNQSAESLRALTISPKTINEIDGPKHNDIINKPLIVISAHPQQKSIVCKIKSLLSDDYNIWCSIDLYETINEDDLANNTPPYTPNQLPTIDETKETEFNEDYKIVARKIVDQFKSNNNKQRPKSMPNHCDSIVIEPKRPLTRLASQTSETSHLSSLSPDTIDRLRQFKEQTNSARVVIIIGSDDYYKSTASKQQAYYCEHRHKYILVRCDNGSQSVDFHLLKIITKDQSLFVDNPRFDELLKSRVKRTVDPSTKAPDDELHESKLKYLVEFMKTNLPVLETCVYVVGSTKIQKSRSEEICRAIGVELAKVKNVNVVTNGFYGVGDIVATSFHEARSKTCSILPINPNCDRKSNDINNTPNSFESSVVHIVPMKDSQDLTDKCRQNCDGSFEAVPYGKTIFLGKSVKERESAVARMLDTCILIEGGPGSAREIEEFIWNDHFVIPIISSGGAASGQFNVPQKIFDCPHGVSEKDWTILAAPDESPEVVAKAVVNIVVALKKAIASHAMSKLQVPLKVKSKLMRNRSGKKKLAERRKVRINAINAANTLLETPELNEGQHSPEKILPVIQAIMDNNHIVNDTKTSKWKRMQKLMTFSNKKC
ncbi:uncharacterized protein LOC128964866 [Oppia nitens]|uniref:uncharacterized protein LOC128964866 n=1 Tax=Oppia nitens TaxID=1686743 RepID=UPI0023DCC469|nr:uncharacterized protein LOC128964866 [Oppia nitens]